ncbi:MAG: hypothetical protein M3R47_20885, partial [Chloroflexota bacterium]|nr:hypothetical protein [Chloroflexota bacterium]
MDIEIAQLAAQVGTFLIPYLIKGGEAFAGETGKKLAEALWGKFKPKVEAKGSAKEAMQDVIDAPEDKGALASFEHQVKKILAEDLQFAAEISNVIENVNFSSMQVGDGSFVIQGNMNGSNIISGNRNIITEQVQIFIDQKHIQTPVEREKIEKAYRLYLEKLRRHCNSLPLAALGGEESSEEDITLDKIYIDLDTT